MFQKYSCNLISINSCSSYFTTPLGCPTKLREMPDLSNSFSLLKSCPVQGLINLLLPEDFRGAAQKCKNRLTNLLGRESIYNLEEF